MEPDNPFAPAGDALEPDERPDADHRSPADLDPISVLKRCWEVLVDQPLPVIAAVIIPILVGLPFDAVDVAIEVAMEEAQVQDAETRLALLSGNLVAQVVGGLVGLFFQLGAIRIFLEVAFGRRAEVGMIIGEGRSYLSGLGASMLVGVVVLIGFILLIIPGIIASLMLYFTLYAVVDRGMGPIEAMKESADLTEGHKISLFVVNLFIGLIVVAFICVTLGIGTLVAVPMVSVAQAVMYHTLVHERRAMKELWG